MSFRKVLVPVTGGARDECALTTAFAAAEPFGAHVAALFVHADPRETLPFGELPLSPDFVQELIDTASNIASAAGKAARANLAAVAERCGVEVQSEAKNHGQLSACYSEITGYLPHVMGRAARLSDLVVFPPLRTGDAHDLLDAFCRVLFKSACPVLLTPSQPPKVIGHHIAVGWDDGISCARALVEAMPYLAKAETITFLTVGEPGAAPPVGEAMDYLHLHGLSATARIIPKGGRKVAEALLAAAQEGGADMLIIGGYSRGRMAEAVFGGVSEHIVTHLQLPVFMVH